MSVFSNILHLAGFMTYGGVVLVKVQSIRKPLLHTLTFTIRTHEHFTADPQNQVNLLGLDRVGVVNDETATKSCPRGLRHDECDLIIAFWIELKHASRAARKRSVKRREERAETSCGRIVTRVCIAEPLKHRDTDSPIETTCTKHASMSSISQDHISFYISFEADTQHARTDIESDPFMPQFS